MPKITLTWYDITLSKNWVFCVIVKISSDYKYIYNVIDFTYYFIAFRNDDYDSNCFRSFNRLQSIKITN